MLALEELGLQWGEDGDVVSDAGSAREEEKRGPISGPGGRWFWRLSEADPYPGLEGWDADSGKPWGGGSRRGELRGAPLGGLQILGEVLCRLGPLIYKTMVDPTVWKFLGQL